MIEITDSALERLEALLDASGPEEDQCLRLTEGEPGDFGLSLDWPREGDELYARNGRVIIVIEDDIIDAVEDSTLDVIDGPDGPQLGFRGTFEEEAEEA